MEKIHSGNVTDIWNSKRKYRINTFSKDFLCSFFSITSKWGKWRTLRSYNGDKLKINSAKLGYWCTIECNVQYKLHCSCLSRLNGTCNCFSSLITMSKRKFSKIVIFVSDPKVNVLSHIFFRTRTIFPIEQYWISTWGDYFPFLNFKVSVSARGCIRKKI